MIARDVSELTDHLANLFRPGINLELQSTVEKVLLNTHENPMGQDALQAASGIQRFERLTAADQDGLAEWRKTLALVVDD